MQQQAFRLCLSERRVCEGGTKHKARSWIVNPPDRNLGGVRDEWASRSPVRLSMIIWPR